MGICIQSFSLILKHTFWRPLEKIDENFKSQGISEKIVKSHGISAKIRKTREIPEKF